jgi:hypothetical protein
MQDKRAIQGLRWLGEGLDTKFVGVSLSAVYVDVVHDLL